MINKKVIILLMTLIVLIMGVSMVTAADATDNATLTTSSPSTNLESTQQEVEIQELSSDVSSLEIVTDDNTIKTQESITKNNNKNIKTTGNTYVVTNSTFSQYFTDKILNDNVSDGDTLDLQGTFNSSDYIMIINKPVNIISSTHDAYVDINTTSVTYMPDDINSINAFMINNDGSNTNVSDIYFHNTQIFVSNANNIVLNNISAVVENQRVGSGTGQTSIRDNSTNITVKNSYFYTENNGGSSTLVLAAANNCLIENNTIRAFGTVGNLFYLTTYNVNDKYLPTDGSLPNSNNIIRNNRIIGPDVSASICYAIAVDGENNQFINNSVEYCGDGVTKQWERGTVINNTFINNTFHNGSGMNNVPNSTYIGNEIYDNGVLNSPENGIAINNTAPNAIINENSSFINNIIDSTLTFQKDTTNASLENNTLNSVTLGGKSQNTIKNNTITNMTVTSNQNTIINNTIINDLDFTIIVKASGNIITDNYLVSANYTGDDSVDDQYENTVNDNIPESTIKRTITTILDDEGYEYYSQTIYANEGTIFTVNVTDSKKNPVTKGNVTILINNNELETLELTDGLVTTSFSDEVGTYNLTVRYNANDKYSQSISIQYKITIIKVNTITTLETLSGQINDQVNLTATIQDTRGNNVTNGSVVFTVGNKTYNASVNNGKAIYKITLNKNLNNTSINAVYLGTNIYKESTSSNIIINVSKRKANLNVTTNVSLAQQDSDILITVKVKDNATGKLLSGTQGYVIFKVTGLTLKDTSGSTLKVNVVNGTATTTYHTAIGAAGILVNKTLKDYDINVTYINSNYDTVSSIGHFNVARSNVTFKLTKLTVDYVNNKVYIVGTATDYKGNALVGNTKFCIKLNDHTTVNANGKAQLFIVNNGAFNFTLSFNNTHTIKAITIISGERVAYQGGKQRYLYNNSKDNITVIKAPLTVKIKSIKFNNQTKIINIDVEIRNNTNGLFPRLSKVAFKINNKVTNELYTDSNGNTVYYTVLGNRTISIKSPNSNTIKEITAIVGEVYNFYGARDTSSNVTIVKK